MDKQLIERAAIAAMCAVATSAQMGDASDYELSAIANMNEKDKALTVALFSEFLARIDAERGKDAVALLHSDGYWTISKTASDGLRERLKKFGCRVPVFLSPTIPEGMAQGIEAVAKMLDKKADDYAAQYGYDDMGSLSFGSGNHAEAKREYHTYLIELEEEVRAMLAAAQGERK